MSNLLMRTLMLAVAASGVMLTYVASRGNSPQPTVASHSTPKHTAAPPTIAPHPGMTLAIDDHGNPKTPFRTVWSHIVQLGGPVIHGVPVNSLGAPVAVLSCDASFQGKHNAAQEFETLRFTVLNETQYHLRYTRIAFRVDRGASYEEAILFDLKPYEMRSFVDTQGGESADGNLPGYHDYPHWMLCGAGPAQKADGSMLKFNPPFFH